MVANSITRKTDGRKIFHYNRRGISFEIDEVTDGFVLAKCSVSYYMNVVDVHAKTKKTLINRLFNGI